MGLAAWSRVRCNPAMTSFIIWLGTYQLET